MPLAAATVVDAVAARLVPMAATGGRVYTSRTWPLAEADLPAWRVTAEAEDVLMEALSGAEQTHTLSIAAQCSTRAVANLDDALNDLALAGLALLFAGVPPYRLVLDGIDRELATEGEAAVGRITLNLTAIFLTAPSAPQTIL